MNLVDHYTAMFVDVSKQRFARAWKFFLLGEKEDLGKAQCQLCKKHLKCNGSTKGLNDHLKEIMKRGPVKDYNDTFIDDSD